MIVGAFDRLVDKLASTSWPAQDWKQPQRSSRRTQVRKVREAARRLALAWPLA